MRELNTERAAKVVAANQAGKAPDFAQINLEMVEKAKILTAEIDPATIDIKKAFAWARLFAIAEKWESSIICLKKLSASENSPAEKFDGRRLLAECAFQIGDADLLSETLVGLKAPTSQLAMNVLVTTAGNYIELIIEKQGVEKALMLLDTVEASVSYDQLIDKKDRADADACAALVADTRADLLIKLGKTKEARSAIVTGLSRISVGNTTQRRRLIAKQTQIDLIGTTAPKFTVNESIGIFPGIEKWKGKVILLEFFAHWCGPSRQEFPLVGKMLTDLKPKGFEVFAITRLYGYYNNENLLKRDMLPTLEIERLRTFVVDQKINWPVAIVSPSVLDAYGASAIPYWVVIGRDGKVAFIEIGYSEKRFAEVRTKIESLLK